MEPLQHLALSLHIVAFAVWLGNLFAIAVTLTFRNGETEASVRTKLGELGRNRMGRAADVGATLALLSGVWLISFAPAHYMRQPWLHMKLTLVLVVLGLHGFLRVRAKKAAEGDAKAFPAPLVGFMTMIAVSIVMLVVFKPLMQ